MIVDVLIAQSQTENPLTDQRLERVLDALLRATVGKTGRKAPGDVEQLVRAPKQQRSRVRRHPAAIEAGNNLASAGGLKRKFRRATVCVHGVGSALVVIV